jgi:hypothetical protein
VHAENRAEWIVGEEQGYLVFGRATHEGIRPGRKSHCHYETNPLAFPEEVADLRRAEFEAIPGHDLEYPDWRW